MITYKGRYYKCASDMYGSDVSLAFSFGNIRGSNILTNDMLVMYGSSDDFVRATQTIFFCTVKGSSQETIITALWANFAGNSLGYSEWCSLSFDGKKPYLIRLIRGTRMLELIREVPYGNNYGKNGSFEADRKRISSDIKPVQSI